MAHVVYCVQKSTAKGGTRRTSHIRRDTLGQKHVLDLAHCIEGVPPMPTEREKQAEKERVTKISGFRVGYHDLLAEIDLPALKARNDRWEAEHQPMTREERSRTNSTEWSPILEAARPQAILRFTSTPPTRVGPRKRRFTSSLRRRRPGPPALRPIRPLWRRGA